MEQLDLIVKLIEAGNKANDEGHQAIINEQKKTNGSVKKNTSFRIESQAVIKFFKWGLPIVGATGIINLIHIIIEYK